MEVESKSLIMEIDTGASLSIISEQTKEKLWPSKRLLPTTAKLRTYSGEEPPVKGTMKFKVLHKGHQNVELSLIVVNGQGPSLLGRDWMDKLKLNWQEVHQVKCKRCSKNIKHCLLEVLGLGKTTKPRYW